MKSVFKLAIHLSREGRHGFKPLLAAIFLSTIFYSCSNFVDSSKVEKNDSKSNVVEVSGKLIYGALPNEIADALELSKQTAAENSRTAFPSIPTENLDFEIKAVNADDSTEVYTGETVTDGESVKYKIGIPSADSEKKYKIEVSLAIKPFDTRYEILKGKIENVKISNLKTVTNQNITLSVPQDSSEFGILDLEVDCTGTEIKSARASVNYNDHESAYIPAINNSGKMRFLFGEITEDELEDGMPEGSHKVKFDFYSSTNCTGVSLYSFTECINIFSALTTDTWVQNGDEPWFVTTTDGDGKKTTVCKITNEMIEEHKLTEIYVDPTVSSSGSGIGPWSAKKNFSEAVALLKDENKDYTIYINGTLEGSGFEIPDSINAKSLTLCGARGLNTNGVPKDAIDGGTDSPVLIIRSDIPVTIKNLLITNGMSGDQGVPGGILIDANDVTLSDGALVKNNLSDELDSMGATSGSFKIRGSAYIPAGFDGTKGKGKNDVGLSTGETIKIAGKLTPPAACTDGIVATITPVKYTPGIQLVELEDGVTDTTIEEAAKHFTVTPETSSSDLFFLGTDGKLITPVMFDNGSYVTGTGSSVLNEDDGTYYKVVNYSYLNHDNLKMSVSNPYGDELPLSTTIDGGTPITDAISAKVLEDGYHTITTTLTRPDGSTESGTKRVLVKIKPVKVTLGQIVVYLSTAGQGVHSKGVPWIGGPHYMYIEGDPYPTSADYKKTCITIQNDSYQKIQDGDNACRKYCTPEGENSYVYLTDKNSTFYFYTNVCRCTYMETDLCKVNRGNTTMTRTLSSLKPTDSRHFVSGDINSAGNSASGGPRGNYWFDVSLTDD